MADITIAGLPLQTVVNDSDIAHISSGGVDKRVTIETVSKNLPIGYIYTQYPNKDSPSTLGLVGTRTNISSTFAGNFFRTEGGNASAFESGTQADALEEHDHVTDAVEGYYGTSSGGNGLAGSNGTGTPFNPTASVDIGAIKNAKAHISETRAINETIRIWERTA